MSALKGNLPESSGSKGGGVEASLKGREKEDIVRRQKMRRKVG